MTSEESDREFPRTNEPVEEIVDAEDEVDDLLAAVTTLQTQCDTRHTEILERLDQCRIQSENLSKEVQKTQNLSTETPALTQILTQLTELRVELEILKSSMVMTRQTPPLSESVEVVVPNVEPNQERSMEEPSEENETPKPARKNRFI